MKGYVIIAAVAAFLVSALTGPYLIRLLRRLKFGQKILEDGPTWHMKKQNTPTMGGFIFILGITVAVILLSVLVVPQTHDWRPVLMLGLSLLFGAVGFIDDWTKVKKKQNKGLTVVQKLLLQIAAATLFVTLLRVLGYCSGSIYIPFFKVTLTPPWLLYLAFAVFAIVAVVNAVNLTDGIDGLCATVTFVVAAFFAIELYAASLGASAAFATAVCGALLGFLLYNKYPARVFMGDTGSLFLGGTVCAMAFVYDMPVIMVFVGLIYVIEALSDVLQVGYYKLSHGKRIFKMAPIHHHLEKCAWSERKIVFVFTLVTAVMCALSILFA